MNDTVQPKLRERSEQMFWIWLSLRLGPGCRQYPTLLERFGSAYDVFEAREERLRELLPELSDSQIRALSDKRLDQAFAIEEYCRSNGIRILRYNENDYPFSYRVLPNPPLILYCRGELPAFQNHLCVAIVGTRKMSEYGRGMAYKIAYELAAAGAIIVSGMALGIDSIAACAAMKADGRTIALLGGGVDVPYPPEHERLMGIIANRGVLMSEYAPGSEPMKTNFPLRNRLISGLCQATVVVDADERSGALITAGLALEQGRDLFAVPANVGAANASGTNRLIRDGAHVALSADDILSHYEFLYTNLQRTVCGTHSDYDPDFVADMGIYSRVVGGLFRIPAQNAGSTVGEMTGASSSERSTRQAAKGKSEAKPPRKAKTETPTPSKPTAQPQKESGEDPRISPKDRSDPGDRSSAAVASLNETQRSVLEAIPMDEPIAVDKLKKLGLPMGALLAAISVLQIKGLVRSLPGGMISRN